MERAFSEPIVKREHPPNQAIDMDGIVPTS